MSGYFLITIIYQWLQFPQTFILMNASECDVKRLLIHDKTTSMMSSSNGDIYRVTGRLCGEFPGHRCITHTKASDAELWYILWSAPWKKGWANNREAGDLIRHHAHYDVIVTSPGYSHLSRYVVFCRGYIDLAAQW